MCCSHNSRLWNSWAREALKTGDSECPIKLYTLAAHQSFWDPCARRPTRNAVTSLAGITEPYHPEKMRWVLCSEGREKFVWHWLTHLGMTCHTFIHFDGTWRSAQTWEEPVNRSWVPSRMRVLVFPSKLPSPKQGLIKDQRDVEWEEGVRVAVLKPAAVVWALVSLFY